MGMTDRNNKTVLCESEEFNQYASLSKEKIMELAELLKRARLPKDQESAREKLIKQLLDASKK